jgi:MoaA/NifB/PqqE/SkfB family radical SAM enzyme
MNELPCSVWLTWVVSDRCHMGCEYCISGPGLAEKPVTKIRIPELMRTLDRTGLVFRIYFTGGGEPFLVPNLTEACLELTRKHYISIATNLVETKVREFLLKIDPTRVQSVVASCHIKALQRRGLLDRFIDNYRLCRERGIPVTALEVAYPALLGEVEHWRTFFRSKGVELAFNEFCGSWNGREYPVAYTAEERAQFGFTLEKNIDIHAPNRRGRFICNAGHNVAMVKPNGDIAPCFSAGGVRLGNIYRGINLRKHMMVCPADVCNCPLYEYDRPLYAEALRRDHAYVQLLKTILRVDKALGLHASCLHLKRTLRGRAFEVNKRLNNYAWYVQMKRLIRP